MSERFDDLPVLAGLGDSLRAAMARADAAEQAVGGASGPVRRGRRWRRPFSALSTVLVLGLAGTAAAAATLTVLRGSPIPAPRAADLQPAMTARASTQNVLSLRADDGTRAGMPPYALRTGTSETGLTCVTVGQVVGDRFGVVGTDGRYRELPPTLVDGCGLATDRDAAVAGARVFASSEYDDVRTVVYGIGGPQLESASLSVRGRAKPLDVDAGAFLAVVRGYPEDNALVLRLTLAGGTVAEHELGVGPMTVVDPSGPAWQLESGIGGVRLGAGEQQPVCITLRAARPGPGTPLGPPACGASRGPRDGRPAATWFFDIRRLRTADRGGDPRTGSQWNWSRAPDRTLVWGYADPAHVARVTAAGPTGPLGSTKPTVNGAFAIVLPGTVDPSQLTTTVTETNGRSHRFSGPQLPLGRLDR